jgi:hypothetical protein
MILGIIGAVTGAVGTPVAVASAPHAAVSTATSVVGVSQGTAGQQQQENSSGNATVPMADDPRLAKFTLTTNCDATSSANDQVHGKQVILRNRKVGTTIIISAQPKQFIRRLSSLQLYLDEKDPAKRRFPDGHPFAGFYLEYPVEGKPQGLVSTVKPEPPELNWIFVDKNTLELTYGNKTQSLPHIFVPWDWTEDMQSVTLEGWEGFVAVEESDGSWILCYDWNDNDLGNLRGMRRVVACSLDRKMLK